MKRRKTIRRLLLCAVCICAFQAIAAASRTEHMVSTWQPINYDVSVTFDDKLSELQKARTVITVQVLKDGLDLIDLDFGDLPIDDLTVEGKATSYDRPAGFLNVHLPRPMKIDDRVTITITYHGRPKDGLVLGVDKDNHPSATGDNWPNRVHHWIPSLDHPSAKATVTFTVNAPARDLVVANGELGPPTQDSNGTRTWVYHEGVPIPAYCMVIVVGEFARLEPTTPAITPLSYYVAPSEANRAVPGFVPAAPSLKFFSETIAPYPYEKLALIVGATRFGGMENSSAIVFASGVLGPRRNPRMSRAFNVNEALENVVAHEIAHQWFGDSVTEASWADLWLSEGFATYFAGLVSEKYDGEEAFQEYMKRTTDTYLAFAKTTRIPLHDTETETLMDLLNANNYQKGACVLHMLRLRLGDDAFFRGLRKYYADNKNSIASSNDLRKALEAASGKNLQTFFSRWVFGAGHPRYQVASRPANKNDVVITLKQLQPDEVFTDPVPLEITAGKKTKTVTITPRTKSESLTVRALRGPITIKIDPRNTILKEVE